MHWRVFRAVMQQHEVGHGHALLYLAHASWLERRGAHTAAKAAYELGISRFKLPTLASVYVHFCRCQGCRLLPTCWGHNGITSHHYGPEPVYQKQMYHEQRHW